LTIENIQGGRTNGARHVAISPDGRFVAVTATAPQRSGIYLVSMQGIGMPDAQFWIDGEDAVWFPDSTHILFSKEKDLYTVALNSTDAKRITNSPDDERAPRISPDGTMVAFYSTRSGHQDIWLVATTGGTPRQLTQAADAKDDFRFAPAWSPDGKEIAYISNQSDYWSDDVWVADVATGKTRQLSHGVMAMSTPVWSPDGKSIALLGTSKNGFWYEDLSDIYLLDAAQGTERMVKMQVLATDSLHSMPIARRGPEGKRLRLHPQHADPRS
jgi:Tol biopolymer transport system component